ncbi:hypothetical protein Pint_02435 [Pistacia integerrima]|uniref:Uncharacterized protein n=1 Tax=Pistacia integerrima TaxID=434235 RepID=A0ACC0ZPU9_9ROSI|nr:hypothetical protein Pint_02435 [Pistacia integerrima]
MICRKTRIWPFIVNLMLMILVNTYSLIRLFILFILRQTFSEGLDSIVISNGRGVPSGLISTFRVGILADDVCER